MQRYGVASSRMPLPITALPERPLSVYDDALIKQIERA
jgi:hypothetical protein